MDVNKHIDIIEKKYNDLENKKRNKSECDLIEKNNTKTFKFVQDEITELKDIVIKNKESLIEINLAVSNQTENITQLKDDVEKLKWFKLETIRRFILIVLGSVTALLIPFSLTQLLPAIISFIEILVNSGVN